MTLRPTSRRPRPVPALLGGLALAVVAPLLAASPAAAAELPAAPAAPATVTADALPTVQVDGVVWSQVVVGDRVYVTGDFDNARPAGAAPGTQQVPRSNILAYDLPTGELVTSWAPSLNAQGLVVTASPDGRRIYVGGDFTSVSGTGRNRIAALDATTGAVVSGFAASANSRVRTIAAAGDTVYAGGLFTTTAGRPRARLAAFSAATGAVQDWAPTADAEVMSMAAPAGTGTLVVGGRFQNLTGTPAYGLGALDLTTGQAVPFTANAVVRNAGSNAAIYSLASEGGRVYGSGYTFGSGGNLENTFAADAATGALAWVSGCRGDTYSVAPVGEVLYSTGHPHDCSMVGGLPQTDPWTWQRAMATTTAPSPSGRTNTKGAFAGRPAPEQLHWLPTLEAGTVTGQSQAGWSVAATGDYVVLGGEFPRVNGTAQQGLTRFAVRAKAPGRSGPDGAADLAPTPVALDAGTVRVSWTSAWDRDDASLTYEVLRGTGSPAEVVATVTGASTWWSRPRLAANDATAPAGATVTYRVRATDAAGNTVTSPASTVEVPGSAPSAYAAAVRADGATSHWRLGEAGGTTGYDRVGVDDLVLDASAARGAAGALLDADTATTFAGTATTPASTRTARRAPQTLTAEAWVRTTTNRGGKVLGFGNRSSGASTAHDRNLYMANTGQLVFGVNGGSPRTIASPARYNDGRWHHVVATMGTTGTRLFVDGRLVAQDPTATRALDTTGYWRVGGDAMAGWPSRPSSSSLAGSIDEVAIYPTALSAEQVAEHFRAATVPNAVPVAAFEVAAADLRAAFDAAGSSDADGRVVAHRWDLGDGTTSTEAAPVHTYAAAGTYRVTLTVTDDRGATGTTTREVAVTAPAPERGVLARDTFARAVIGGFGTADVGGAWTPASGAASFSVADGAGRITTAAGSTRGISLNGLSSTASDVTLSVALDKASVTSGSYASVVGRRVSATEDYRLKLRYQSTGAVTASLVRLSAGTETTLTTTTLSGVTAVPGEALAVRLQVTGTSPTTLAAKVWPAGAAEPEAWALSATDATAALQAPGGVGVVAYLSGSATSGPVTTSVRDLAVRSTAPADGA